jgi:hypothetical protein
MSLSLSLNSTLALLSQGIIRKRTGGPPAPNLGTSATLMYQSLPKRRTSAQEGEQTASPVRERITYILSAAIKGGLVLAPHKMP